MGGFTIAAVMVGWFAVLMFLGWAAIDWDPAWPWLLGVAIWVIGGLGVLINAAEAEDAKGPCLREETSYQWSPATKTVMPYTYCADRGTWSQ